MALLLLLRTTSHGHKRQETLARWPSDRGRAASENRSPRKSEHEEERVRSLRQPFVHCGGGGAQGGRVIARGWCTRLGNRAVCQRVDALPGDLVSAALACLYRVERVTRAVSLARGNMTVAAQRVGSSGVKNHHRHHRHRLLKNLLGIDGEPILFEWNFLPRLASLQILVKIQSDVRGRKNEPENVGDRIIFMSNFTDIDWTRKGYEEKCISNSEEVKHYAKRFSQGHWTLFGPGDETTWYGYCNYKPEGKWNSVASKMVQRFEETGHSIFMSSALSHGTQSTEKRLVGHCALFKRCHIAERTGQFEVCRIDVNFLNSGRRLRASDVGVIVTLVVRVIVTVIIIGHMMRSRYRAFTEKVCSFPCQSSHESQLLEVLFCQCVCASG